MNGKHSLPSFIGIILSIEGIFYIPFASPECILYTPHSTLLYQAKKKDIIIKKKSFWKIISKWEEISS
jgi:hypothetical protein